MKLFKRSPAAGTIAVSVLVGVGITALINGALARGAERRNPPKGKFIEIELAENDPAAARTAVEAMCSKLLANTVIESYAIEIA